MFAVIGPFMMMITIGLDLYYLMIILCYYEGCRHGKIDELAEDEIEDELKV